MHCVSAAPGGYGQAALQRQEDEGQKGMGNVTALQKRDSLEVSAGSRNSQTE